MSEIEKLPPLIDGIVNYVNMKNSGALLITGNWGCGKTYYLKNTVRLYLKEQLDKDLIIVSLFGLNNLNEIPERILCTYGDEVGKEKTGVKVGTIANITQEIGEMFPKISEYVDIKKIFSKGHGLYKLLPKNDVVICLDDLERVVNTININEVLGVINELVENIGYKVIVIANEGFIDKSQLIFKEKVVEKTIAFMPETLKIFEEIVSSYENEYFTNYMREKAIHLILPDNKLALKSDSYKKHISNIRILKFAIEHFYRIFSFYQKQHEISDPKIQLKLKNYWAFILAVSIEYKLNYLSFEDIKQFESYTYNDITKLSIDNDDSLQEVSFDEKPEDEQSQDTQATPKKKYSLDSAYLKRFYEKYFKTQGEYPIFHREIYSFITGGVSPNFHKLDEEMNMALGKYIHKNDPAIDLLGRFMNGIWNFSNNEIGPNLQQLFCYVKYGEFNDYVSYLNASLFLQNYQDLMSIEEEEIKAGIRNGVDIFSNRITVSFLLRNTLQMVRGDISGSVIWIYEYIMQKLDAKENEQEREEIKLFEQKFCHNLQSILKDCIYTAQGNTPQFINIPVLKYIKEENIVKKISTAEPNDIYMLTLLLSERYEKGLVDIIREEIPFVKTLKTVISKTDFSSRKLSNKLIEIYLMPKIESILSQYPSESE